MAVVVVAKEYDIAGPGCSENGHPRDLNQGLAEPDVAQLGKSDGFTVNPPPTGTTILDKSSALFGSL